VAKRTFYDVAALSCSGVRSLEEAAGFVDAAGLALVFPKDDVVLPSLWEAVAGSTEVEWARRDGTGRFVEFTPAFERIWRWKDELPARRLACAGQHGARPISLVAPRLVRAVYALTGLPGRPEDFRQIDTLDPVERAIAEAVLELGPLSRPQMRRAVGSDKRRADRAAERLQRALVLTNAGLDTSEPGWPAVKMDLLSRWWRARLRRIPGVATARLELTRHVVAVAGELSAADLGGALGWRRAEAAAALHELTELGELESREEDKVRLWRRGRDVTSGRDR
jgi:hypothetical protein